MLANHNDKMRFKLYTAKVEEYSRIIRNRDYSSVERDIE